MAWFKFVWVPNEEDFVLEWVQELGWNADPFSDAIPEDPHAKIAGYNTERGKINLFVINQHRFGLLRGYAGTGKTMVLRWLYEELQHGSNIIAVYLDSDALQDTEHLIKVLAEQVTGFFSRVLFKSHKSVTTRHDLMRYLKKQLGKDKLIVLIDDVHKASKESRELFAQLLEEKISLQMIAAGRKEDLEKSGFSSLEKDQLGVSLDKLDFQGAHDMIFKRIESVGGEGIHPFSEEILKHIVNHCHGNAREILKECRKVAIKSTVNSKMNAKNEELPPAPAPTPKAKDQEEKLDAIKKKITTIDYVKDKKNQKKKPDVEVVEHEEKKKHKDDEEEDMEEKEKNDRLIHELFDSK